MRASCRLVPFAALAASTALFAAGCGGSSSSSGSATTTATAPPATTTTGTGTAPLAHAPEPTTSTPTPTNPNTNAAPPAPSAPAGTTPTTPETKPGGAGDEQPVRVPASFTVRAGRLTPATITVPPFLSVQVTVAAADGAPHTVLLRTPTPQTLRVAGGKRASVRLAGLRAGRYAVELDGRSAGTLVAGGEVGP